MKQKNIILFVFFCSIVNEDDIIHGINKYLNISGKVIFGPGMGINKKNIVKKLIGNYNYKKIKQGQINNKIIIDDNTELNSIKHSGKFIFILQK